MKLSYLSALLGLTFLRPLAVSAMTDGFPYDTQQVRGVNLGGWLSLEASPSHARFLGINC